MICVAAERVVTSEVMVPFRRSAHHKPNAAVCQMADDDLVRRVRPLGALPRHQMRVIEEAADAWT